MLIELARKNVEVQEEALRIADARFRNGATSELDVSQARTLFENTRASIPQLEASLIQAKNALSTLLGQPTGGLDALLQGPAVIPAPPAQVAASVPAEMLRRRPDIRSAELVAMSQSERIGVAKAALYPRLVLSGTVGLQATTGESSSRPVQSRQPVLRRRSAPPLAILQLRPLENQARVEDARFQQLLFDYQNAVLKAGQEVEDGAVGFLKAQEAAAAQENAVTAARRSVELALLQYRDGAVDFMRVLDAERTQLQEENSLARIRSSMATSLISLYKALGGGWEMSVGQPVLPEATQKRCRTVPTGAITSRRRRPPRPHRKKRTSWLSRSPRHGSSSRLSSRSAESWDTSTWKSMQSPLPEGIVSGNGRIEGQLVDASAKEPLRVKEMLVNEGDLVRPGQVVVRLDTITLEADLAGIHGRRRRRQGRTGGGQRLDRQAEERDPARAGRA